MAGLYIHIPFCAKKCHYCDFNSWPDGSLPSDAEKTYFKRLRREAELLVPLAVEECASGKSRDGRHTGFETVYLGGGTPSSVDPSEIARLFDVLSRWIDFGKLREVTIEANPESISPDKIAAYKRIGIGRISLGVQTFEPKILETLGRIHSLDRAYAAIREVKGAGLKSWTFDLMYGLPGQTVGSFLDGVKRAIDFEPPHISTYGLTIETGTEFGRWQREGSLNAPDGDFQADCFEGARELFLKSGYGHYEISNFAKPGHEAVHNSLYWRRIPYLSLGAGAHGCWPQATGGDLRWSIPRPFDRYAKYVDALEIGGGAVTERLSAARAVCPEWNVVGRSGALEESVFLGIRLLEEGVSIESLTAEFGVAAVAPLVPRFESAMNKGWLERRDGRYLLAPRSVLVSNRVIGEILAA